MVGQRKGTPSCPPAAPPFLRRWGKRKEREKAKTVEASSQRYLTCNSSCLQMIIWIQAATPRRSTSPAWAHT
eukprot:1390615-Pyramimonas_sp.AAC.1